MGRVNEMPCLSAQLMLAVVALLTFIAVDEAAIALAQETSTEIVAAAVRQHGHACANPQNPEPDLANTTADEKAWIIQCENGKYRVKFTGGAAPKVEPVSE